MRTLISLLVFCLGCQVSVSENYHYSTGQVAYDGKNVLYKNGYALMDQAGNIWFENGMKFRDVSRRYRYNYPNGAKAQDNQILTYYPEGRALYTGLSFDYPNGRTMARAAAATDAYFDYANDKPARNTHGQLFDTNGNPTRGPVILYSALKDDSQNALYGHVLSVLRRDSYMVEVAQPWLFQSSYDYVQVLPQRWVSGTPTGMRAAELVVDLGNNRGLLLKIGDNPSVQQISLIKEWQLVTPAGIVEVDFNQGVRHLHGLGLIRNAMQEAFDLRNLNASPEETTAFALQGRFGRINVREIFPGCSVHKAKVLLQKAVKKIEFDDSDAHR